MTSNDIRTTFTGLLQTYGFKGRDYAEITRAMKRWLNLDEELPKWDWKQDVKKIVDAEEKAISLLKKFKVFKFGFVAETLCFIACKTI